MALKPYRENIVTDVTNFMFETGTRGGVVVAASGTGGWPTGDSVDNTDKRVRYAENASGLTPVGVLATDVVNIDQSRQHVNQYKSEVQIGDKVTVYRQGRVATNNIAAGEASGIAVPATAYVGLNGNLYTTAGYNTSSGYPEVGRFITSVDADGYAILEVNLP